MIHPSAIIEDGARLGADVTVGPFSVVGAHVELGDGVALDSHVVVTGRTTIGARTRIFPFASIGHQPQDLKYKGEPSTLTVGTDCMIREHVTINPGTEGGGMETVVGNHCLLMAGAHVAHDCRLGDHVIMANCGTLAGHVEVGPFAFVGGLSAVHQFVRIGTGAMIGGMSGVESDVIPYGLVMGNRAHLSGLNIVGLKRRGFTREQIQSLRSAYRLLFAPEGTLQERLTDVAESFAGNEAVAMILQFMQAETQRSFCTPRSERAA